MKDHPLGPHLCFKERKIIQDLISKGFSCRKIGLKINRTFACVANELYRNGGRLEYNAEKAQKNAESRNRSTKTLVFSEEQQKIIAKGAEDKLTLYQIAALVDCSHAALTRYLYKKNNSDKYSGVSSLEERIGILEMQMTIVIEALESKNDR